MTDQFEIVQGDHGRAYVGVVEHVNYSDCAGKIYVWNKARTLKIVNGKACSVVYASPDTQISFIPETADFNVAPDIYYGMFTFEKDGVVEHTLEFVLRVIGKEPAP